MVNTISELVLETDKKGTDKKCDSDSHNSVSEWQVHISDRKSILFREQFLSDDLFQLTN